MSEDGAKKCNEKVHGLILPSCTRPEWGYSLQLLKNYSAIICSTAVEYFGEYFFLAILAS